MIVEPSADARLLANMLANYYAAFASAGFDATDSLHLTSVVLTMVLSDDE